jgi:uncharacterized membrane protein YgdD (TMEM256/DUF423 family)
MSLLRVAGALMFIAVALGAFGAHGLRGRVAPEMIEVWRTAVLYQLVHGLALVGVALAGIPRIAWAKVVAGLFIAGIVIFSGSLYLLVVTGQRWLGAVTPLGGVAFLGGWAALTASARRG